MEGRVIAAGPGGSVVQVQYGGRRYPTRFVANCKTCHSPYRVQIEKMLLKTYGYTAIHRSLPEDADVSVQSIKTHARGNHMDLDESVRRAVVEEHAREVGLDIDGHEAMLANHITFAKLGIQRVIQRFMDGELEPDLDHGIAFANLLMKVEQVAGDDIDKDVLNRAFMVQWEAIRAVCSPEQMQLISSRISGDPVMKALVAQQSRAEAEDDDFIDVDGEE